MTDPAVETKQLSKRYDGTDALSDVSLTVPEHSIFGLLGANGAGKSTLIDILMDFVRPTSGSVTVAGHDAQADTRAVHERVGVLPDGFDVFDRLSGRRHLQYVLDARDVSGDPDTYLERVGLEDAASKNATAYSRGMQQRLALAIALVGEPDVLVLDEPFTGLDPDGTALLREVVSAEHERGATVLLSSHQLGQIQRLCTDIGMLRDGTLVAEGSIGELLGTATESTRYVVTASESAAIVSNVVTQRLDSAVASVQGDKVSVKTAARTTAADLEELLTETDLTDVAVSTVSRDLEDIYAAHSGGEP